MAAGQREIDSMSDPVDSLFLSVTGSWQLKKDFASSVGIFTDEASLLLGTQLASRLIS